MADAIARAAQVPATVVRRAAMLSGDTGADAVGFQTSISARAIRTPTNS